jgi:hypothetical protein
MDGERIGYNTDSNADIDDYFKNSFSLKLAKVEALVARRLIQG